MKTGRTLGELAREIERQNETKKDYVTDTRNITLISKSNGVGADNQKEKAEEKYRLDLAGVGGFEINDICHGQIASRLGIPMQYYNRMTKDAPSLLQRNVNYWLMQNPEKRMIRTLDGNARAFLSNRYRPIDNHDLAGAVLPIIADLGCKIESCELTERRLYLKCVNTKVEGEIKPGDRVQAGVIISNSEVGCGAVRIDPLVYRLVCKNGMIANDFSMRKYHIGRSGEDFEKEAVTEFYKDETRLADDRAMLLKVRDVVEGALSEAIFQQIVGKMQEAHGIKMKADPVKCVENVAKKFGFSQEEQSGVLRFLIEGGDLSLYGVMNAVTRQSQEVADYDRATDFERFGGQILDLPQLVTV